MNSSVTFRFSIPDLPTGNEILARIQLANPQQAVDEISVFLDSLLHLPPSAEDYFLLLENARKPVAFVADELSRHYLGKPLPLGDAEEICFQKVLALWLKMVKAYAHCAQLDEQDASDLRTATFLFRCIHYTGMAIVEHQRARREYPWGLWLELHGYYASAEEWEVATLPLAGNPDAPELRNTHCLAAYIGFLLVDMAGCYSLSAREQALVRRWAMLWAPLVGLHRVRAGDELPRQLVDLMHDAALRPRQDCLKTEYIRRLDTARLALQIKQVKEQLRRHVPPSRLALGEDCSSGQCLALLNLLANPWSQTQSERRFRRRAASGVTRVCSGFDEMYYYIAGKPFEQPESNRIYSRREYETLFAFRYQENPQQTLQIQQNQLGFSVDTWEVLNESANGFRLLRNTGGRKMTHGQIIGLSPQGSETFLLARVAWLTQEKNGGLITGIETLPGTPQVTSVRMTEPGSEQDGKYHPAFLLPSTPSSPEPTLLLPPGWYRPGRFLELFTDKAWQIQLAHVVDDGPDFELVGFTLRGPAP